jgi:hypothetical protein
VELCAGNKSLLMAVTPDARSIEKRQAFGRRLRKVLPNDAFVGESPCMKSQ